MLLQRIKPCRYKSELVLTLFFCLFSNNLYACLSRIIDLLSLSIFTRVRVLHISVRYGSHTENIVHRPTEERITFSFMCWPVLVSSLTAVVIILRN